jgi:NADPH:quinone reductase-like Zn-dependent oxidoreductase
MGTRAELEDLLEFLAANDLRPVIDSTYGFTAIADAFAHLESGNVFGKVAVDYLH